jgi:hypothetical protein
MHAALLPSQRDNKVQLTANAVAKSTSRAAYHKMG